MHRFRPIGLLVAFLVAALIALLFQFVSIASPLPLSAWSLNNSDLDRLEVMLKQHAILTDEDLREIDTRQLRNVLQGQRPERTPQTNEPIRTWFLPVAFIGIIVCIVILFTCYPARVFLWGDEIERYANTVQKRRVIWGIIISVTVVSVLSRFLFEGVSSWFG